VRPGSTIRVAAGSDDGRILRVGLERYVAGVVAGETSARWPDEALRAQAVAARSYAVHRLRCPRARGYDVTASTLDQCFREGRVPDRLRDQVSRTAGEYLTGATTRTRHAPALRALFHTSCGGHTDDPVDVWSTATAIEHHRPVACLTCIRAPRHWEATLAGPIRLEVIERTSTGRVAAVRVDRGRGAKTLSADELRASAGYGNVRSARFEVFPATGGVALRGTGLGHGVGLCQVGARGMAEAGAGYREILAHYYPGSRLASLATGSTGEKPRSGGIRSRAMLLSSRR
jgi:stage II sporulation protein D